ncbi:MAG: methyltransferase domain-containing protein [Solirubrobacteraceae bacterium]
MSAWDAIWQARRPGPERPSVLAHLMAADGLDSGFAQLDEPGWVEGVTGLCGRLGLSPDMSVFEVGCGAGAFLYVLANQGFAVAGLDQSPALVARAAAVMPSGAFTVADATQLNVSRRFDAVVSYGVFMYFRSEPYAGLVLERMRDKARRLVAVLDVPDRAEQAGATGYRERLAGGPDAYAERYAGLEHRYYDRDWMAQRLLDLGLIDVRVERQSIDPGGNGRHRFNAWGSVPA